MTLTELYAEADRLLDPDKHPRNNATLKERPEHFTIDDRLKFPKAKIKALVALQKKIYAAKENA